MTKHGGGDCYPYVQDGKGPTVDATLGPKGYLAKLHAVDYLLLGAAWWLKYSSFFCFRKIFKNVSRYSTAYCEIGYVKSCAGRLDYLWFIYSR